MENFLDLIHRWWIAILSVILALFVLLFAGQIWEWNSDEDLQMCQYPWGEARFINQAGMYWQMFGVVTTYPRNMDIYFSAKIDEGTEEDTSIRVTYSDAGIGYTSHVLKLTLPADEANFMKMHRHFAGVGTEGIKHAIGQHLATCLKNTGPMMSASEFQMQGQNQFYQTVRNQLEEALFEFETVEQRVIRQAPDPKEKLRLHQFSGTDEDRISTTRIKMDTSTSKPIIIVPSPLREYGFNIAQYSLTETTFDEDTKKQIDARRNAYQLAEQAKASVQKANQETTQAIEAGKAEVAKVEAGMKKELRQKIVAAEQDVGVAEEAMKEAVNKAGQTLATAEQAKLEADQLFKNSDIELKKAQAESAKMLADSMAEKAKLEQGGALAAVSKLRAEQNAERRIALAEGATKIPSPKTIIFVPKQNSGSGSTTTDSLIQMWLMRQSGITSPTTIPASQSK
ncbi:MAG: hypothetical protein WC750_06645 [Patescibacteria group bacterium]|jgi:hypothetical protein